MNEILSLDEFVLKRYGATLPLPPPPLSGKIKKLKRKLDNLKFQPAAVFVGDKSFRYQAEHSMWFRTNCKNPYTMHPQHKVIFFSQAADAIAFHFTFNFNNGNNDNKNA